MGPAPRLADDPGAAAGASPRAAKLARAAVLLLAVAIAATSLWLPGGLPLVALADLVYDDALYVKLGAHVSQGRWLGPYDESTLAKGPGFPVFVAAAYRCGLPLLLAGRLLRLLAAGLLVAALLPLLGGRVVPLLLFAALVLDPVVVTRAAREVVYPSFTLVAVAGAVGLFVSLPRSRRRAAAWAVLCGLGLGALWLTREEGVWIVPTVGSLLVATVARTAIASGLSRRLGEPVLFAAIPAAILFACLAAVSLVNLGVYGVFTVRESSSDPFLPAYGSLVRIRSGVAIPRVPLPREARRLAYGASPAARSLEPYLEGDVGRAFGTASAELVPEAGGEIAAGWLQFALRDAAAKAGHYRDARTAAAFWRRVARELDMACDEGRLRCGPNPRSMTPPGLMKEVLPLLAHLPANLAFLASSVDSAAALRDPGGSRGPGEGRAEFARVTGERLSPASDDPKWLRLAGWAFVRGRGPVDWRVRGAGSSYAAGGVRRLASGDVAAALGAPEGASARVELVASCAGACRVELSESGLTLVSFDPTAPQVRTGTPPESLAMSVDAVELSRPSDAPGGFERDESRRAALRRVAAAYRAVLAPGLPAAFAALVLAAVLAVASRGGGPAVVVGGAVFLGVVSRVSLLALIERTSFPALHYLYLAPAYPLLYAFVVLSAVALVRSCGRRSPPAAAAGS